MIYLYTSEGMNTIENIGAMANIRFTPIHLKSNWVLFYWTEYQPNTSDTNTGAVQYGLLQIFKFPSRYSISRL